MNGTLDWSWKGMNGNFNFRDCADGYEGFTGFTCNRIVIFIMLSEHGCSTGNVTFFLYFYSVCYTPEFQLIVPLWQENKSFEENRIEMIHCKRIN